MHPISVFQILSVDSQANCKNCCHQMAEFKAKMHQIQNCHGPLCTAKKLAYDIAGISETTSPIEKKFQDNKAI